VLRQMQDTALSPVLWVSRGVKSSAYHKRRMYRWVQDAEQLQRDLKDTVARLSSIPVLVSVT
jgi:hypothetical protein